MEVYGAEMHAVKEGLSTLHSTSQLIPGQMFVLIIVHQYRSWAITLTEYRELLRPVR
jgi:hypothetical protein